MKKPILLPLLRLCGAAAFSVTFAACSGVAGSPATTPVVAAAPAAAAPAKPAAPAATGGLMQQIHAEIGEASCDTAAQCKTVAIGHKACGGPESYLAYSTKGNKEAKVTSLAAAYAAERKASNVASGRMSTCSLMMDPGATCSAGKCVTNKDGLGGVQAR